MPHLRATCGRLITIRSIGGVVGQPFNETYCTAKAATEAYMESLAPVAAEVGVTVSVVEPGPRTGPQAMATLRYLAISLLYLSGIQYLHARGRRHLAAGRRTNRQIAEELYISGFSSDGVGCIRVPSTACRRPGKRISMSSRRTRTIRLRPSAMVLVRPASRRTR